MSGTVMFDGVRFYHSPSYVQLPGMGLRGHCGVGKICKPGARGAVQTPWTNHRGDTIFAVPVVYVGQGHSCCGWDDHRTYLAWNGCVLTRKRR